MVKILSSIRSSILRHSVVSFYLLVFGIEFGSVGVLLALGLGLPALVVNTLIYLPTIIAVLLSGLEGGWKGIWGLLKKFGVWRVGVQWYLFALFGIAALGLVARGLYGLAGGDLPEMQLEKNLAPFAIFTWLIGGALAEEAGWRGFVLPRLQTRMSALSAALIIGVIWGAVWHLPMFLTGSFTVPIVSYVLLVISWSILFTWVYNNTHGSLLIAVLFHLAINVTGNALAVVGGNLFTLYLVLSWVVALAIILVYGPSRLARRADVETMVNRPPTPQPTRG